MNGKSRERVPNWVIALDVVVINLSMLLAYLLRYRLKWLMEVSYDAPLTAYWPFALFFTLSVPLGLLWEGGYQDWRGRTWLDHVSRIINAVARILVLGMALAFVLRPLVYSRLLLLEAGVGMIVLLSLDRIVVMVLQSRLRRKGIGVKRVVIVGAGEVGRRVIRTIVARRSLGYEIVGYVDDNPQKGDGEIGRIKGLGPVDTLAQIVDAEAVDEVIITLPWTYHRRILSVLRECERRNLLARIVPDFFQLSLRQVEISDLGGVPMISIHEIAFSRTALLFKRIFDVVGALLALTLFSPFLALIALAIKLDSPGPVIFSQERVGEGGRRFHIYKFRSMRKGAEEELERLRELNEADGPLFKIREDPRLTRIGVFLRHTSLDELPQLLNVLKGEMSLVGPRPPLAVEVEQYQPWHKQRLSVPPGMTGLWQVSGRSELAFDEMVLLDIYYIEHWSPWLDFTILLRTIPKVVLGEGAY
ncbi:MAG: undecaprenyl-phosphate glucose phosphotransferase [Anaerolineae bacterium]|jgi:exopolysaccharide biosynthesis polyprenyl glycosylphosphotransferase|nr:undecaprenyl-phosphate glucose phosphotransferase [Anaerolineae bacterium]